MHELLVKRTVHHRIFTRLNKTINSLLENESASTQIIEIRLKELSERWMNLQEAHDAYIVVCISESQEDADQDRYIEMISNEFYVTESSCMRYLDVRNSSRNSSNESTENALKFQRIKFPTFDGHVRNYPKFKYEFNRYIKPMCSRNQLTFVLKSYLCESVRNDVENCDQDIEMMWHRLDTKYGTKQKLIDSIIVDIKRLPEENNSSHAVLEMIRVVEAANNDLRCIECTSELNNSAILSIIEKRMNAKMQDEWVQLAIKTPQSDKFETLISFLGSWKNRIEYQNEDIRKRDQRDDIHTSDKNADINTSHGESAATKNRKCLIHRDCDHPIWRCRVFKSMSVPERLQVVRSRHACSLCLDTGHNDSECSKVIVCSHNGCHARHNILLHSDPGT